MNWERQRTYDFESGKEAGIAIGQEQGTQQKAIEAAINLLKLNKLSIDEIAQAQGLPVEKVQELKSQVELQK
jgi:predicted transposase YdaD